MLLFDAGPVLAGLRAAVVGAGQAQEPVGAGRAQALEAVDLVHAGPAAHTRVGAALVDVLVTFGSFKESDSGTESLSGIVLK